MGEFTQLLVSGTALGAVYALVALGFTVIYRATRIFNFAQGELLALGAFLMSTLHGWGLPWIFALAGTLAANGFAAAAAERLLLRGIATRSVMAAVVVTIFLGATLRVLLIMVWGADPRGMPTPWNPMATLPVGDATVLVNSVVATAAAGAALFAFFALLRRTNTGLAIRAVSSDAEAAAALGIPVGRTVAMTWFMAGAFAALGGVLLGMFPRAVDPNLGYVALRAFPAVIVGGLDSPAGVVAAGVAIGILEVLAQGYVNPILGSFGQNFHAVLPYLLMIAFLAVRPYGVFGRPEARRA